MESFRSQTKVNTLLLSSLPIFLDTTCWRNNQQRSHVDPRISRRFNPQVRPGLVTSMRTSWRLVTTLNKEIISVPGHLGLWHISGIEHLEPKDSTGGEIFRDLRGESVEVRYNHLEGIFPDSASNWVLLEHYVWDFGFIPESRTLHGLIRPLSRESRDKSLSHNQRNKTPNNEESGLKR